MRKLLLATLLAGVATPAFAQEASPFTGFRLEAIGGYDKLKSGDRDDDGVDTGEDEGDESLEGAVFGVGAGYDFDLGGVVAGVEAEFTESTGEQEADETLDGIDFTSRVETGRDIYVGGRVGAVLGSSTLLYAKAGYVNGRANLQYDAPGTVDDFDDGANLDGVRLGGGAEFALGRNLFAKAEYRYSNYEQGVEKHQVVAGVGFRF